MPKPRLGETKEEFIARVISYFIAEGYSHKEAKGRSYGFWETYKKKQGRLK